MMYTATYSPEDNKIRLSASSRLDAETYARVKAAGFSWAPRQEIFVAPMWTPGREDLALELAGEIGDEDTTLVDRAEARAERFDGYKDNRILDAERASAAVSRIADNIPFGQPILVGHHSERHARKDAQRIENGMRKTVKMWETAKYWEQRAAGALSHAKYKELPGVRHRRIKTLTAEMRKCERSRDEVVKQLAAWTKISAIEDPEAQKAAAIQTAGHSRVWVKMPRKEGDKPDFDQSPNVYDCLTSSFPSLYAPRTVAEVLEHVLSALTRSNRPGNSTERWITHYTNRIAYERAMLGEQGGLVAQKHDIQIGGRVQVGDEWLVVLKLTKKDGDLLSVTTTAPRAWWAKTYKVELERIRDYKAPAEGDTEKVKAATKLPPMCNYPGEGFAQMTEAEWKAVYKDHKGSEVISTETTGKHRRRCVDNFIARKHGAAITTQWGSTAVFITDAKRIDPPAAALVNPAPSLPPREYAAAPRSIDVDPTMDESRALYAAAPKDDRIPTSGELYDMQKAAKQGVQVVAVPQLFPTPPELAARMVEIAEIEEGHRVLEPSAGTGVIVNAIHIANLAAGQQSDIHAVELNASLAHHLAFNDALGGARVTNGDFLAQNGNLGQFDRVLMNPPFGNAEDIKHIKHALHMLKPGGRLVAICANGPRQQAALRPLVDESGGEWEDLPAGTFKDSGTNVNTALLTIYA